MKKTLNKFNMRNRILKMKSKTILQFILATAFGTLFFACANNNEQHAVVTDSNIVEQDSAIKELNIDTIASNLQTIEEPSTEPDYNSEIAVFSSEGKMLWKFKYYYYGDSGEPYYLNRINGYPSSETQTGDYNGDGKKEKAYFLDRGTENEDCQFNPSAKSCMGIIRFTDKNIKPLLIQYCPFGQFKNEGDLNNDGKDEIGVLPGWYSSACRYYHVFTYKDSLWTEACPSIGTTLNMREAGIIVIEKDRDSSGYAIIRESTENYYQKNPKYRVPEKYAMASCAGSHVVEYRLKLK